MSNNPNVPNQQDPSQQDPQWHGQQPPAYTQGNHFPPAPPYVNPPKKNWFLRHKVLTGLGALLVIGIAAGAAGGSNKDDNAATSSTTSASSASADGSKAGAAPSGTDTAAKTAASTKSEPARPGLNTPVRDGKFEFTVTKVQMGVKSVGDQYLNQQAQGQFVLITVTVKNIGTKPQTMFDSNQKVTDNQGRTFDPDTGAAIYMSDNKIWMKDVNPGNSVTGTLVYDMPADAKPTKIELHDSMFSGGVTVLLTK